MKSAKINHEGYTNQKLILLDGMWEVNEILSRAAGKPMNFDDLQQIIKRNPYLQKVAKHAGSSIKAYMTNMESCMTEIENGDPKKNGQIADLAEKLRDLALDVDPSLSNEETFIASEDGPLFDVAAIAEDREKPMFSKTQNLTPKSGAGDGAFRIVINTDCCFFQDPTWQCASVAALAMIIQQRAPLEVWIQQGWLGNKEGDGITLFPIHKGGAISPQNLYFWVGSPRKDSPFSWFMNKALGRVSGGVSGDVEIPCDLYLYNVFMPTIPLGNLEEASKVCATWIAATSRKMLFEEEAPENIGEDDSLDNYL